MVIIIMMIMIITIILIMMIIMLIVIIKVVIKIMIMIMRMTTTAAAATTTTTTTTIPTIIIISCFHRRRKHVLHTDEFFIVTGDTFDTIHCVLLYFYQYILTTRRQLIVIMYIHVRSATQWFANYIIPPACKLFRYIKSDYGRRRWLKFRCPWRVLTATRLGTSFITDNAMKLSLNHRPHSR